MIPSAHIEREYHGLLRPWKRKPCVICGCNFKFADKRFYSQLLFKKHRIEKSINSWALAKIPILGPRLAAHAKTVAVQYMFYMEFKRRQTEKTLQYAKYIESKLFDITDWNGGDDERN